MENIDWEQRRYEIAKELYIPMIREEKTDVFSIATTVVDLADLLIKELKKNNRNGKYRNLCNKRC